MPELAEHHQGACFSESPLDDLERLIEERSDYGVGFKQEFLKQHGGRRVEYLQPHGDEAQRWLRDVCEHRKGGVDPQDPFWHETRFVDIIDPTKDASWETEWRVPGGLNFVPEHVEFLFLPEHLHDNAREFFIEHLDDHTGPAYLMRYLDPHWDRDRIERTLRARVPDVRRTPVVIPASPFARRREPGNSS